MPEVTRSALQSRQLHTLRLVGCLPYNAAQLIYRISPIQIHIKISVHAPKIDRTLFPTVLTMSTCHNLSMVTKFYFSDVYFPLPRFLPSTQIKYMSISNHVSLRHLVDACSALGSTLESPFISGYLDANSSSAVLLPVETPRPHALGVGAS